MAVVLPVKVRSVYHHFGDKKDVYYPVIKGMQNITFQEYINSAIQNQIHQLIVIQESFRPKTELLGTFELKNNQRNVLSLSITNYTYHDRAAHGMTIIKSLNFDLEKQNLISLSDLFKPNSDYIERLSAIIHEQIKQRDIPVISEFTKINPDQDFYLADRSLVIYFQLYDITPYYYGFPMFPISIYEIYDIIKEDGPLGRLSVNN